MTRTTAREIAMHITFGMGLNPMPIAERLDHFFDLEYYATLKDESDVYSTYPDERQMAYIWKVCSGISAHLAELDGYIEKYAKNWKIFRISRLAVTVMRTAMYEILYMPDIPNAAAINEAVELAKKYEDTDVVSFTNGILGSFVKGELIEE